MKSLSIAMLGNTNNYPLMLAEGLIGLGHRVKLLVNRKETIHRPESVRPEWSDNYPEWIIDVSEVTDFDLAYETPNIEQVINRLNFGVDLVILNDFGPALARYLRNPHLVFLTGSDLTYYANFESVNRRTASWDPSFRRSHEGRRITKKLSELVMFQREGILMAEQVSFGLRGLSLDGDQILDSIGVMDEQRTMIHISGTETLHQTPVPSNRQLRILNGSRVLWRQSNDHRYIDMDLKGTDILINGFAMYCRNGGMGELRMFRKGGDVEAATQLIDKLKIKKQVAWLDEMPLYQFRHEMASADIICDQFGLSFPGMVSLDAFAMGRPILANLRNEIFGHYFNSPLPGLQASSAEEVCHRLLSADDDRKSLISLGETSRRFAEDYLSPRKMAEMLLQKRGFLRHLIR